MAALVAVEEVPERHIVVHHRHDTRVGGHVNSRETLNEDVRTQAANVTEERLKRGGVQAVGDRRAGQGAGAVGGRDRQARREQPALREVSIKGVLDKDGQIAQGGAGSRQAGYVALGRERVQGQADADRGTLVKERFLDAEEFTVELHLVERGRFAPGRQGIEIVVEIERDEEPVLRHRALVVGHLVSAPKGRRTAFGPACRNAPNRTPWSPSICGMPARENPSKLVNSVELSASAWAKTFSGARASAGATEGAEADGCVDGMGLLAGGRAGGG